MAKIINKGNERPAYVRGNDDKKSFSSDRSKQELSIGLEAKKYLDSFATALNDAPSDRGIYWSVDAGETTFSNNLNNQKLVGSATRFLEIRDMVLFGQKVDKEIEKRDDEEREAAYTPADQERIMLQGTIRPNVGDHWMSYSQGRNARLYMVTNVDVNKLIDKPIYTITLSSSPSFNLETIRKNVTNVYKFIFGNIGSQRKTIMLNSLFDRVKVMNEYLMEINKMYVKMFYDETYDILRYNSRVGNKTFTGCKALREFQDRTGILRYGEDFNTLFVGYPFVVDDSIADYKLSYINKIIKRKLKPFGANPEPLIVNPMDITAVYKADFEEAMMLNEENELMLEDDKEIDGYEPKYDLDFRFYIEYRSEFSILTNFRKSDITLMELNSRPTDPRNKDLERFIRYRPTSKIFQYIIDKYMDKDYDAIINSDILEEYTVLNNNIDDYMLIPIIIYIVSNAIEEIEKDDLVVSF